MCLPCGEVLHGANPDVFPHPYMDASSTHRDSLTWWLLQHLPCHPVTPTWPLGSWWGRDQNPRREEICAGTLGSEAQLEIPSSDGAEPDPSPLG